jgi:hypothetical protein
LSTTKIIVVRCDLCGTTALPTTLIVADAIHMEHPVDSVSEARRQAHERGWVHDKLGRDICSACRTFPPPASRKPKIRIPHPHWH